MSNFKRLLNVAKGKAKLISQDLFTGAEGLIDSAGELLNPQTPTATQAPSEPQSPAPTPETEKEKKLRLLKEAVASGLLSKEEAEEKKIALEQPVSPLNPKKRRL